MSDPGDEEHWRNLRLPWRLFEAPRKLQISAFILILSNCVPLVGTLVFGHSAFSVFAAYWVETIALGILTVAALVTIGSTSISRGLRAIAGLIPAIIAIGGIQVGLMGLSIGQVYGPQDLRQFADLHHDSLADIGAYLLAVAWAGGISAVGLVCSHLYSFVVHFVGDGEWRNARETALRYGYRNRLMINMFLVCAGFFVFMSGIDPRYMLVLFVPIKTWLDLAVHVRKHMGEIVFE